MADSGMASLVPDKIDENQLLCSMCGTYLKQPKILDCLHTFCAVCLHLYRHNSYEKATELKCPQCRQKTKLTEKEVDGLPDALELAAQVEEVTMLEKLQGQGSDLECESCEDGNQVTAWCMDCVHFLCAECQRAHERMALMKSHQIYTLAQLRSGAVQYRSKLREFFPKCETHTQQNVTLYCNTCDKLVCMLCILLTCNHGTPKHSLVDLNEASETCKQQVDNLVAECEQNKSKLTEAINTSEKKRRTMQSIFHKIKNNISQKTEKEIARLKQEEDKLLEEINKIYAMRASTFESIRFTNEEKVVHTEQRLEVVKQRMAQSNSYEIVNLKHKVLKNLQELMMKKPERVPDIDRLLIIDFEEGEKTIGRLVKQDEEPTQKKVELVKQYEESTQTKVELVKEYVEPTQAKVELMKQDEKPTHRWSDLVKQDKEQTQTWATRAKASLPQPNKSKPKLHKLHPLEKWDLKAEIIRNSKYQFNDVEAFSNNEVVLADIEYKGLTIKSSKPQSTVSHRRVQIQDLSSCPRHISVDENDRILVLDGNSVKIFNKNGELCNQFSTVIYSGNNKPTCLAADGSLIAVGYMKNRELLLYNHDGSFIKTLSAPMIQDYLTVYKKKFIYTNWSMMKLYSVHYDHGILFSVNINEQSRPNGVCCNSEGSIYVAVWSFNEGPGGIQQYTPDGEYIGCVTTQCAYPRGITITPCGDMVVTAGFNVFVFSRDKTVTDSKS